jgi:hypothetical protein
MQALGKLSIKAIAAMYCHGRMFSYFGHFSPKVAKYLHITSENTKKYP